MQSSEEFRRFTRQLFLNLTSPYTLKSLLELNVKIFIYVWLFWVLTGAKFSPILFLRPYFYILIKKSRNLLDWKIKLIVNLIWIVPTYSHECLWHILWVSNEANSVSVNWFSNIIPTRQRHEFAVWCVFSSLYENSYVGNFQCFARRSRK